MPILPLLLFLSAIGPISALPEYGIPTGLAGLVLYFWRQDRKDRALEQAKAEERHAALAADFRTIVQENTQAIDALTAALSTRTVQCPWLAHQEDVDRRLDALERRG